MLRFTRTDRQDLSSEHFNSFLFKPLELEIDYGHSRCRSVLRFTRTDRLSSEYFNSFLFKPLELDVRYRCGSSVKID